MDNTAKKIINLIDASGKPETEIEKDLGLPRSTIYDWRNDRSKSYKKYTYEVSNYFNVSADYLLGNEQKNKLTTQSSELKPLVANSLKLLNSLPQDLQEAAEAYLQSLSDIADKRKKK